MLLKRQILSWISIVVFFASTTGMSVYKHICHSSNSHSVSLSQLLCEDVAQADNCCSGESSHGDCCDLDVSFEKYTPTGKVEQHNFTKEIHWAEITPFQADWQEWIINRYTENVEVLSNPPNPQITQPKTVSERLSYIQSYLC